MVNEASAGPIPVDTGADGTQEKAVSGEVLAPIPPRRRSNEAGEIATSIEGIAGIAPHKLGGDAMARLVAGSFKSIDHELSQKRDECRELREEVDDLKEELGKERIKSAILSQKVKSSRIVTVLSNAAITLGATALGVGFSTPSPEQNAVLISIGSLLLIVGWVASMFTERELP